MLNSQIIYKFLQKLNIDWLIADAKNINADADVNLEKHIIIDVYEKIPSTITILQNQTLASHKYYVCLAEQQTQGQGQLGRSWYSPQGLNIYFSLAFISDISLVIMHKIGLITGLACIKTLEDYGIQDHNLKIKWPNDIFYNDAKLAGILINTQKIDAQNHKIIISVGLNVNMEKDDNINLSQAWTSIKNILATSTQHDRNYIIALMIKNICYYLKIISDIKNRQNFLNSLPSLWQKHDYLYGKNIQILHNNQYFSGIGYGINSQGNLQLKSNKNNQEFIQCFSSGKVLI